MSEEKANEKSRKWTESTVQQTDEEELADQRRERQQIERESRERLERRRME